MASALSPLPDCFVVVESRREDGEIEYLATKHGAQGGGGGIYMDGDDVSGVHVVCDGSAIDYSDLPTFKVVVTLVAR